MYGIFEGILCHEMLESGESLYFGEGFYETDNYVYFVGKLSGIDESTHVNITFTWMHWSGANFQSKATGTLGGGPTTVGSSLPIKRFAERAEIRPTGKWTLCIESDVSEKFELSFFVKQGMRAQSSALFDIRI